MWHTECMEDVVEGGGGRSSGKRRVVKKVVVWCFWCLSVVVGWLGTIGLALVTEPETAGVPLKGSRGLAQAKKKKRLNCDDGEK